MARIGKSVRTVAGDNQRQMLIRKDIAVPMFIGQAVSYVSGAPQPSVKPFAKGDKFAGFIAYQHDNIMDDETKPNVLRIPVPGSAHVQRNGNIYLMAEVALVAGDKLSIGTDGKSVNKKGAGLEDIAAIAEADATAGTLVPVTLEVI